LLGFNFKATLSIDDALNGLIGKNDDFDNFTPPQGMHTIGGIFITGIWGNVYTKWGEFLTFRTGISGGPG